MTDDKDPALLRLFAEDADLAPPPDFARSVEMRIARLRRRQAILIGVAVALSGAVALTAARLIGPLAAPSEAGAWLNAPAVMAVGGGLVLLLVARSRLRMRRR